MLTGHVDMVILRAAFDRKDFMKLERLFNTGGMF